MGMNGVELIMEMGGRRVGTRLPREDYFMMVIRAERAVPSTARR